jgi:hypothetical protein
MGEIRNTYKILIGKYERKRPFRRYRQKWEYIIKIDLRGLVYGGRLIFLSTVINLRVA